MTNQSKPTIKNLMLTDIRIDGGTQPRAAIDDKTVADYADEIKRGAKLPPVVVFDDGTAKWLADGFHRWHGHNQAGKKTIPSEVRQGTLRDAILYSVGANATHGLRRTNADKRRAVETLLKDEEWSQRSNGWIAKQCGVSDVFVGNVRSELTPNRLESDVRAGQDGRIVNTANIGASNSSQNEHADPVDVPTHEQEIADEENVDSSPITKNEPDQYEDEERAAMQDEGSQSSGTASSNTQDNSTQSSSSPSSEPSIHERIEALPLAQALAKYKHTGRIFRDQAEIYYEQHYAIKAAQRSLTAIRYTSGPVTDAIKNLAAIPEPEKWEGCATCKGSLRFGENADPCPRCKGGFTVHSGEGVNADVVSSFADQFTAE